MLLDEEYTNRKNIQYAKKMANNHIPLSEAHRRGRREMQSFQARKRKLILVQLLFL